MNDKISSLSNIIEELNDLFSLIPESSGLYKEVMEFSILQQDLIQSAESLMESMDKELVIQIRTPSGDLHLLTPVDKDSFNVIEKDDPLFKFIQEELPSTTAKEVDTTESRRFSTEALYNVYMGESTYYILLDDTIQQLEELF